jgi:uncharacterized RDD family membrane protein YckC
MQEEEEKVSKIKAREILIASWWRRFFAWLVDALVIYFLSILIVGPIVYFLGMSIIFEYIGIGLTALVYWTLLEGTSGSSLGKKLFRMELRSENGDRVGIKDSLIESIGKSFLLPIDFIIGLLVPNYKEKRQRLFNKLSKTIVISTSYGKYPYVYDKIEYYKE